MTPPTLSEISLLNDDFPYVEDLLKASFPDNELRPSRSFCDLIENNPDFHCMLVSFNAIKVGVLNWWSLPNFNFCEHFAIDPKFQNRGIGSKVLRFLKNKGPLVLEVESPITEVAKRRISFYEKQGLTVWSSVPYFQPPYKNIFPPVPMSLMASPDLNIKDAPSLIKVIYNKVYNV